MMSFPLIIWSQWLTMLLIILIMIIELVFFLCFAWYKYFLGFAEVWNGKTLSLPKVMIIDFEIFAFDKRYMLCKMKIKKKFRETNAIKTHLIFWFQFLRICWCIAKYIPLLTSLFWHYDDSIQSILWACCRGPGIVPSDQIVARGFSEGPGFLSPQPIPEQTRHGYA